MVVDNENGSSNDARTKYEEDDKEQNSPVSVFDPPFEDYDYQEDDDKHNFTVSCSVGVILEFVATILPESKSMIRSLNFLFTAEGMTDSISLQGNKIVGHVREVNNRGISIAVLRTYLSKCKERMKQNWNVDNSCDEHIKQAQDELGDTLEEAVEIADGKKPELKSAKVLEALAASG